MLFRLINLSIFLIQSTKLFISFNIFEYMEKPQQLLKSALHVKQCCGHCLHQTTINKTDNHFYPTLVTFNYSSSNTSLHCHIKCVQINFGLFMIYSVYYEYYLITGAIRAEFHEQITLLSVSRSPVKCKQGHLPY